MKPSKWQIVGLVLLRLTIGWHFLYEGVVKFHNPYWSAKGYLLSAEGALRPFFTWLSSEPMIAVVNAANVWPQLKQNLADGGDSSPQLGQVTNNPWPQLEQNLASSRFSVWQLGQIMAV